MSVEVTPELEELVQAILRQGDYADETEVLKEALRLLQQKEQLRRGIEQSLAELDSGERIPADEVFQELYAKAAELMKQET